MKKFVKASEELSLTSRQVKKGNQLLNALRTVVDILDDEEFSKDGEFAPLLNNPELFDDLTDDMIYLSNLLNR